MLPFRPRPSEEEPVAFNATAHTARKQTATAPPSIRKDDQFGADDEASSRPVVGAAGIVPIAEYKTPSIAPSEAVPSSCGETFSTLSQGTLRSRLDPPRSRPLLAFETFIVYNDAARLLPFEIEGHPEVPGSHVPNRCPLPWQCEFSWTDGAIFFGSDPLSTAQTHSRPGELDDATFGDSMERSERPATLTTDVMTCTSADEVTCKSWSSVQLRRAVFERGEIERAIEERRAYLLEQLEAHWRSHPPQRSSSRQKGKGPAHQAEQRPSARAASQPYSNRGFAGGRRRIGQGSGDGDEKDDDEGDSAPAPASSTSNAQNRWWACPYQKWRPQHYLFECGSGFRRITDVKAHLLKKHFAITCPQCRGVYDDKDLLRLHIGKGCQSPPRPDDCFMSERQRTKINIHFGGKRMLDPEKWRFLFRILFPNEPFPASMYLLPPQEEMRNFLESWAASVGWKVLSEIRSRALLDDMGFSWNEPQDIQQATVMMRFFTLRLQEDVTEERRHADFAMAQQDSEAPSSSAACVSAVDDHRALTAPGFALAHDAVAQLPTGEWNPQREPSLLWPMPTVGEPHGIPRGLDTNIHALGPIPASSNLSKASSGFGENAGISLHDRCALASWNVQRRTSGCDGLGISGLHLPGPSSVAQWAGGHQQDEFTHLGSSHLTNGVALAPSASAIVCVDDYTRPLTAWDPLIQREDWNFLDDAFNQDFGPSRILDDDMISGSPRARGLQAIPEMPEL